MRCSPSACGTCAPSRSGRSRGLRGSSWPPPHQADEDVLERALARSQILEVDAELAELAQEAGDPGLLALDVERVGQGLAAGRQLERVSGERLGEAAQRRLQL